jgi:hypothetical protein
VYYEYKVKPQPKRPGAILLKPTWRAYAKALVPVFAVYAVIGAAFVAATNRDSFDFNEDTESTPES